MRSRGSKGLILAAMIAAVAMMFIDQTIVAIAIPGLEQDLSLSATGAQWIINGYLLALSAFFALGGKLADVFGHRRTLLVGIVGFTIASVRGDADGLDRPDVDHRLSRCPGRLRRTFVPGRAGHCRLCLRSPRTRQGAGRLLRHHWGHDLDRAGRRRLPHGVDVAGDLLDQRPGLGHRARPHRPGAHR